MRSLLAAYVLWFLAGVCPGAFADAQQPVPPDAAEAEPEAVVVRRPSMAPT